MFQVSQFERHADLEKEIMGDWLAAEFFVALPPLELQQSVKAISFQTSNIVEWEFIQDGKALKTKGNFEIYAFPTDKKNLRKLPSLIVAPTNSPNPALDRRLACHVYGRRSVVLFRRFRGPSPVSKTSRCIFWGPSYLRCLFMVLSVGNKSYDHE